MIASQRKCAEGERRAYYEGPEVRESFPKEAVMEMTAEGWEKSIHGEKLACVSCLC